MPVCASYEEVIARSKLKRTTLVALGFVFVGIGAVGIVMPLLPTTPFLVLAAMLFSKSSERFHKWLLRNRVFGTYLRHYELGTRIPKSLKIRTIALLWTSLAISAFLVDSPRILLAIVGACVTAHVVMIRSRKS